MENRIEQQLLYINESLSAINNTLGRLIEISKQDKVNFKVEGKRLVGALDTEQKRQFRINND